MNIQSFYFEAQTLGSLSCPVLLATEGENYAFLLYP